ncbi:MAG: DNA translocase FtsK 4TM domain-containing protein [Proteobacteria bacterium]|nr:DNA translocase FtsK 4TM domain-containing protein [Pseudomonadota bacterium]
MPEKKKKKVTASDSSKRKKQQTAKKRESSSRQKSVSREGRKNVKAPRDDERLAKANPRRMQRRSKIYAVLIGLVLMALGVVLFLMLFTFSAADLAENAEVALNIFGFIGAHIADIILTLFGLASFVFSAVCILMGIFTIMGKQVEITPPAIVGMILLVLGCAPLCEIVFSGQMMLDHAAGGALGTWCSSLALQHIPSAAFTAACIVITIFGGLLVTDTSLKAFFVGLWKVFRWIFKTLGTAMAAPFRKTPAVNGPENAAPSDNAIDQLYEETTSDLLGDPATDIDAEKVEETAENKDEKEDKPERVDPGNNADSAVVEDDSASEKEETAEVQDEPKDEPASESVQDAEPETDKSPDVSEEPAKTETIGDIMARIRKNATPKKRAIKRSNSVPAVEPEFEFDSIVPPEQLHNAGEEQLHEEKSEQPEQPQTSVLKNWKPRSIGRKQVSGVEKSQEKAADMPTLAISDIHDETARKVISMPAPEVPCDMTRDLIAQLSLDEADNGPEKSSKPSINLFEALAETADFKMARPKPADNRPDKAESKDDTPILVSDELQALMAEAGFKPASKKRENPSELSFAEFSEDPELSDVDISKDDDSEEFVQPVRRKSFENETLDFLDNPRRKPLIPQPAGERVECGNGSFVVTAEKKCASEAEIERAEKARIEKMGHENEYHHPPLSLLHYDPSTQKGFELDSLKLYARKIEEKLAEYHVQGQVVQICPGPIITRFEFQPAPGTKVAKISSLSDDLMMALEIASIRILAPIPGKGVVGIEIPNEKRNTIYLKEIIGSKQFSEAKSILTIALGKDSEGEPVVSDLAKMPHLLVAGSTGSGKSVGINTMLCSLLYNARPDEVKFILVDPKCLELSIYEGIPHLLVPPITTPAETAAALDWACDEMDERYRKLSAFGVRNIQGYNEQVKNPTLPRAIESMRELDDNGNPRYTHMPYIVIVVDEFADLMMTAGKEIEKSIARLAQKARAAGIHIILATQRPSTNVITGVIKANFPTRLAFRVFSYVDSRTILDTKGAETLLGMGDSLFLPPNTGILQRVHGAYVSDEEVQSIVSFLQKQGKPEYNLDITTPKDGEGCDDDSEDDGGDAKFDARYDEAVRIVAESRQASASFLQRRMNIGYPRAGKIIDQLQREGVIGPPNGSKQREVLIHPL